MLINFCYYLFTVYTILYYPLQTVVVIHGFYADARGLTMKQMLVVGGVARTYLDHDVRPPRKVCSLAHIAQQGNCKSGLYIGVARATSLL